MKEVLRTLFWMTPDQIVVGVYCSRRSNHEMMNPCFIVTVVRRVICVI